MKNLSIIFLIIFLIPSISSGFEPFFKGKWKDSFDKIITLENEYVENSYLENQTSYIKYSSNIHDYPATTVYYFFDNQLLTVSCNIIIKNTEYIQVEEITSQLFSIYNSQIADLETKTFKDIYQDDNGKDFYRYLQFSSNQSDLLFLSIRGEFPQGQYYLDLCFYDLKNPNNEEALKSYNNAKQHPLFSK